MRARSAGWGSTWFVLLLASSAAAQDGRAVVGPWSGPSASALQSSVARALREEGGWSVVTDAELQSGADAQQLGPDAPEVAAEAGALVVISGETHRAGRGFTMTLRVVEAPGGVTLAAELFTAASLAALRTDVRRHVWDRLRPTLEQSLARRRLEVESRVVERAVVETSPPPADDDHAPSPLVVTAGAAVFSRDLSYSDDAFDALRPYWMPAGGALRAAVRWYPGAHVTGGMAAHVGLDAAFGGALGVRSRQRDGTRFPTDSLEFRVGADVRIPVDPIELGVGLAFGMHTFTLAPSESGVEAPVPDVEYQFVRPSLRLRADLPAALFVETAVGARVLTGSGALTFAAWFPRGSGVGLDFGAWLGWMSDLGVGVRAGFEWQRYFFSLNTAAGDPYRVGGASDQYLSGSADLVVRLR